MRDCPHCHESWEGTDGEHPGCWLLAKYRSQEYLPEPAVTDYASSREPLPDAAWYAARHNA